MTKKKYLKYIPLTIAAIFFVYIQVQCDLKLPSFLTRIVDEGIVQQDMSLILKIGIDMLGYVLIGTVATIIVSYLAAIISTRISRDLRGDVFKKIESYSMHEFDEFSTASLITRNTNDIQQVQMCIFMILRMFTMAPIMAVGGIVKAIETSKEISWILAVSIPLTLFVILALMFFIVPVFGKIQGYVDNLNKVSRESLTGIRVIRAFRNETLEEERFDSVNSALTKTNIFMGRMMSLLHPAALLIMNLTQLAIIWFGAKAANLGSLQTGEIAAFINYAMQAIMSFMMLTMAAFVVPRAFVSWKRISAVLKTDSSIISAENAITLSDSPSDSVEFKNVSFSYPGANENVLSDISFIAKKGQTTAFIGSTGCGKSTLVNLIPRFYDITSGEILLGGIDIRNLELKNLREKIGYVPQKSVLFSGTVESNITQGRQNATQQELELAAKIAQAEDFILEKNDRVARTFQVDKNSVFPSPVQL